MDAKAADVKKEFKPYKKVFDSSAVTQRGLIEMMTITRYSKTPAGGGIFGGEEINRRIFRWEKGPNKNILLRSITYVVMSPDEDKPMVQAVKNSTSDPINRNYDILAYKKDETGNITGDVVDLSTTFDADVQTFSLDPIKK